MIDVFAVEKRHSIAFLNAVFEAYSRGEIVFPVNQLGDGAPSGMRIARRVECVEGGGWFSQQIEPVRSDEPAQVTLTSGTTGRPKPILLSHGALADAVTRLIEATSITSEIREYVGVPVTYSFGFGRVRAVSAVGGASFLPENGFRIDELAAMLREGKVNALSAVPTLLRLLIGQKSLLGHAGEALRWLEIGSQAMSVAEKLAVRDLFPNARIVQHYGLTEASRSTFLDVSQASDTALASVGSANGGVELRITDEGLIAIRGPHVATGIVTAEGVAPLTDADGWLVTRDLGRLEDGRLFFEGRIDHLLNIGGIKVSAEAFEAQLAAALPAAISFAIAGGRDALRGQTIVVAHPDALDESGRVTLHQTVTKVAVDHRVAGAFALMPVDAIPVTSTGKVQRGEITRLFDAQIERPPVREAAEETGLVAVYARALNRHIVLPDDSFASLAGDSLGYIEVSIAIERLLGNLPDHWETLSIAQIEQLAANRPAVPRSRLVSVETEMLIRPIAMTAIVTGHALGKTVGLSYMAQYWGGGALALLMAAGYNICRFQKGTLLSDRRHRVATNFLRRVVLPFYLVVFYKCIGWALGGSYVAWSTFLLLDDYIRYPDAENFLVYWFIGALFQCILLLTALFYMRRTREFARRSGFYFGLSLLAIAYAIKLAAHFALLPEGALVFPNTQLDNYAYVFALGWAVGEANTKGQKLACIALAIVAPSIEWGAVNLHTIMLTAAILLILYLPRVRMPIFVQSPIALWARATFFIYLSHGFAAAVMRVERVRALFGASEGALVVGTVVLSTIGGLCFFLLWRQGERIVGRLNGVLRGRGVTTPANEVATII